MIFDGRTLSGSKRCGLWFALVLIAACEAPNPKKDTGAGPGIVLNDSIGPPAVSPKIFAETGGPQLLVDSAMSEARLEVSGGEYILRISPSMARALQDSLPDFRPIPRSDFHKSVLSYVATQDSLARPLSVVVGDFDGNGRQDAAMMGTSRDTSATVMVLAGSDRNSSSYLRYIHRPLQSVRTWPAETYLRFVRRGPLKVVGEMTIVIPLRGEAVEVVGFEKGSVLYYLDGSVLREVITSD